MNVRLAISDYSELIHLKKDDIITLTDKGYELKGKLIKNAGYSYNNYSSTTKKKIVIFSLEVIYIKFKLFNDYSEFKFIELYIELDTKDMGFKDLETNHNFRSTITSDIIVSRDLDDTISNLLSSNSLIIMTKTDINDLKENNKIVFLDSENKSYSFSILELDNPTFNNDMLWRNMTLLNNNNQYKVCIILEYNQITLEIFSSSKKSILDIKCAFYEK